MSDGESNTIFVNAMRESYGYEPGVWPPKAWDPILCEIGRIVFSWNALERTANQILNVLIGGQHRALIATAHMNVNNQIDALKTLATEYLVDDEQDHIFHLIKLFERLRDRRNFYVHSFSSISGPVFGPPKPIANMGSYSARGRLKRHEMDVTPETLSEEAKLFHSATIYFALVHNHFYYPSDPDYTVLPIKFNIPDPLTKSARFVLGEVH